MAVVELVLVVILAAISYYYLGEHVKHKNLPPGPKGLPLLGSLLSMTSKPAHLKFREWAKTYGKVFRVRLLNDSLVLISDQKLAKEAFNNSALLGRPDRAFFNFFADGIHGITSTEGRVWSEQRRFTIRQLKDFGFGKSTLQDLYLTEVTDFVNMMKKYESEGTSVSLNSKFQLSAINSLWMIMTGQRFQLDDERLRNFVQKSTQAIFQLTSSPLILFFPSFAKMVPSFSGWKNFQKSSREFKDLMDAPVAEHISTFEPGNHPRDLVDAYLNEIEECKDETSSFHKSVGVENLKTVLGDLYGAGTATTAETMSYGIMYLCKYPEIQKKLQAEIDAVVGKGRNVLLEDRKNMPYTEAFILETLRKSTITPYALMHSATETTTLAGYTIPKDSWVAININFMHHDPQVWGDPDNFRPERFLAEDGKSIGKMRESVIAFSTGKRVCIGEQMAKDGVFLLFTNIFQRFEVKLDPKYPEPSMDGTITFISSCDLYHVLLKDRIQVD